MKLKAWSFSKLKNYENCPRRYNEVDVLKNYKEDTENLDWGNEVHAAMRDALRDGKELPHTMFPYGRWLTYIKNKPGKILVEQKYGLDKEFRPVPFFGPTVWYRGIADVVVLNGQAAWVGDYKTGNRPSYEQDIDNHSVQLMLMASCVFQKFPNIRHILTEYMWLKEDGPLSECWTREHMTREAVAGQWPGVLARVAKLAKAHDEDKWPPIRTGLCKYCPVSHCQFQKRGA